MRFLSLLLLACSIAVLAQTPGEPPKHIKPKPVANGPVTRAEANAVFAKVRDLMVEVLGVASIKKVPVQTTGTTGLATRDEIILVMDRLTEAAKPSFKISLPPLATEPAAFVTKKANVKEAMVRLVKGGFVNKVDVLLCGPAETIAPDVFGDDIGFLLCRISELSHLPSTKWSPSLMKPGG